METRQKMNLFYQLLGKIFYAAANADKNLRPEEQKVLKDLVQSEWVPLENSVDVYGSDAAFQIEYVFDILFETGPPTGDVLQELDTFKTHHPSLFSADMNRRIVRTAGKITDAVASKNKNELVFLSRLEATLKKEDD